MPKITEFPKKKRTAAERKKVQLNTSVPRYVKKKLKEEATSESLTLAAHHRRILVEYVDDQEPLASDSVVNG